MKKMKKLLALTLSVLMLVGMFAGCAKTPSAPDSPSNPSTPSNPTTPDKPSEPAPAPSEPDTSVTDKIVIMAPPVTGTYAEHLRGFIASFNETYPNITVEIIETSWGDHTDKLATMSQSGEAPDIAEVSSGYIGTLVEMGVAIDIAKHMPADRLADYDQVSLGYMSLGGTTYGLPLYLTIQSIGANKTMMQDLGIDVKKIQEKGWTYNEFIDILKKGTKPDADPAKACYGLVFANSGVTASDMMNIFGAGFGLSNNFTPDLKYAFTSDNMLTFLKAVEEMTKSGYMPNYGVEAGQRLVMCQTGNAMIFGKAMPLFEGNFIKNNAALEANDGSAVPNSLKMDYAFLPTPTADGCEPACYGTVDGLVALRNNGTTDEHLKNVLLFMDYICSGERIAEVLVDGLYLDAVCQSGRDAMTLPEGRDPDNLAAAGRCIGLVKQPPAGITSEMSAGATTMMNEHIVPKFQALLAGETTADAMYQYIVEAAHSIFGADGCASGKI